MACMKLGSKSDFFLHEDNTWFCSTGLSSDVIIKVEDASFRLHKFPLLSRSGKLETLLGKGPIDDDDDESNILNLHKTPGGEKTFLLVAKFCYGVKIELNAPNIASLRCAAEYLQMSEEYGEGNLILQTEAFLNAISGSWVDLLKVLESCDEILPHAEKLDIISKCIGSLATIACEDPSLHIRPTKVGSTSTDTVLWNGLQTPLNSISLPKGEDWWYEDVCSLKLAFYKRLILSIKSKGMKPEGIVGSLLCYAKRYLPIGGKNSGSISLTSDAEKRNLLEEVVELLPNEKVVPTKFLLVLLSTSMNLNASNPCREKLERRIGEQLYEASLDDLLIPSMGYSSETLYDIDCVERILNHFMLVDKDISDCTSTGSFRDDGHMIGGSQSLTPITMVATLVDSYLAKVAPDVNLKLEKFLSIAAVIPDYARPLNDGIYGAIDTYLKAHPWLTEVEREQLCRLMDFQKLSLEASTHAAKNERLPLRMIVQVLFFEQLRLRTSIAGWFFISDNNNNNPNTSHTLSDHNLPHSSTTIEHSSMQGDQIVVVDDMRNRVTELEEECLTMKQELEKLAKNKKTWNLFMKKLSLMLKPREKDLKVSKPFFPKVVIATPPPPPPPPMKKIVRGKVINGLGKLNKCS